MLRYGKTDSTKAMGTKLEPRTFVESLIEIYEQVLVQRYVCVIDDETRLVLQF